MPNTSQYAPLTATYSFTHIAANGTSAAIKSGAGTLHSITVNTKGASSNLLTLYDSLTGAGTVIGVLDTTQAAFPATLFYDANFATGLSAVLATGTAADITILWL